MTKQIQLPDPDTTLAYDLLISAENFKLAWQRVRYYDRSDSRDWVGLKVFASNRDHNLEILRQSLIQRTYQPSFPEIKFIPKSSLTLRPMAVLPIKDRIVYQALANVIAEKKRSILSVVANRQSFANVLVPRGQPYMFEYWKKQHGLFQKTFKILLEEENIWLAETDVAAFYEMIAHSRLLEILQKDERIDDKVLEYLESYLPFWSSVSKEQKASKGVPQGCLSSDLLANIYLWELDEELASQDCHYLRYVDDIRLLATSREAVQRGLINVDRTLKSMGLILQTKKTTVRPITDIDEEFDRMAVVLSEVDRKLKEPPLEIEEKDILASQGLMEVIQAGDDFELDLSIDENPPSLQDSLLQWFWKIKEILDTNRDEYFEEKHFRFLLWRLSPNSQVAHSVIPYLLERPWLSDLICVYLKKCQLEQPTIAKLQKIIETHLVYDSIVASTVEVLLAQKISLRPYHGLFRTWLADGKRDWQLLTSVAAALGESTDNMTVLVKASQNNDLSPIVRRMALIQASRLARDHNEAKNILRIGVMDQDSGVVDTALYLLYIDWSLNLDQLNFSNTSRLTEYCKTMAKGYDTTLADISPCYIRHNFSENYSVSFLDTIDFHTLLGTEYDRAAHFAWQAERSFLTNASRYVSQLDLFHEEILFFILVDKLCVKPNRSELVKMSFPDRIGYLIKNKKELVVFASALQSCHQLRSSCTEAHTRLHQVLILTSPVKRQDRDNLKKKLIAGYQELVDWIENGFI